MRGGKSAKNPGVQKTPRGGIRVCVSAVRVTEGTSILTPSCVGSLRVGPQQPPRTC